MIHIWIAVPIKIQIYRCMFIYNATQLLIISLWRNTKSSNSLSFFHRNFIYHIFKDKKKKEDKSKKISKRPPEYGPPLKGLSLTLKFLEKNSVSPQEDMLEGFNKKSRTHVLNPKYSTPTSLPLYFYFVYQILQEAKELTKLGPVSWDICIL